MFWKILGLVIFLIVLLVIGAVASRRMKNVSDYYAAGKSLNFWAVAFSSRATGESGWLLLGLTGLGAMIGARAFFVVGGEVLGVGLAWMVMSRRFHRLTTKYESITIPDYLESRFGDTSHKIRLVAAGALSVFVTIYVAAQIFATGQAFTDFLGWNYYVGIAVGFAVVMAYSISGGFLAVVWSDIFQGALMFFGLVTLPIIGIIHAGGWGEVSTALTAIDPTLLTFAGPDGWTPKIILGTLSFALIGVGFLGSPQIFVRFLALRDESEIGKGTAVAVAFTLFADFGAVLTGMVGRALLTKPGVDVEAAFGAGGESVFPMLVDNLLPAMLIGLFIAIVLSAIMSTVDSLLVLASSAVVRDVYQKVLHPDASDESMVSKGRVATFALAMIALVIALIATSPGQTVFWFVVFGWSGISATFCPTMILSLSWRGFTGRGAIAAMITGFLCVPFFKFGAPHIPNIGEYLVAIGELPPSFVLSAIAGVLFSITDTKGREAADVSF